MSSSPGSIVGFLRAGLHWTPRICSLLFIAFISLFALDVFGEYEGWELLFALFMHLRIPLILAIVTAFAWKYDFVGASLFFAFAAWYAWSVGLDRDWTWYALIAGPAVLIGILYIGNWFVKRSYVQR